MTKNPTDIGASNVIKTTMEHLFEEQKKQVIDMTEFYWEMCVDFLPRHVVGR
jgi:hypothetical protein